MAHLSADGAFELELPCGPAVAFLVLDEAIRNGYRSSGRGIAGGVEIGTLVVPDGGVLEVDFASPVVPGSIALVVHVNGSPRPGLRIVLNGEDNSTLEGATDAEGPVGPLRALPGLWSVDASDSGAESYWTAPTPILVEPGVETSARLDIDVFPGVLTCLDASGQPLAAEVVSLRPGPAVPTASGVRFSRSFRILTRTTDANGRIELELAPGEYALQRGSYRPGRDESAATAAFTWTASGPLETRVQL